MPDQAGTLELVIRELATALRPLEDRLAGGNAQSFFNDLGLTLPQALAAENQLLTALAATGTAAGALEPAIEKLIAAITAEDPVGIIQAGIDLIGLVRSVLTNAEALGTALNSVAGSGGLTAAQVAELQALAGQLPRRVLDLALTDYLKVRAPNVFPTLGLIGIVDNFRTPANPGDSLVPAARVPGVHLDHLVNAFLKPGDFLQSAFGFGAAGFDGSRLFPRVQAFLDDAGLPVDVIAAPGQPPILEAYMFRLSIDPSAAPPKLTLRVRTPATEDFEQTFPLGPLWNLDLSAKARFDAGLDASVTAPFSVAVTPPTGAVSIDLAIGLLAQRAGGTVVLFQEAGATKLEATKIGFSLGFSASASGGGHVVAEPSISGEFTGGHLKIDLSGGDGFISTITGGANIDANLDFKLHWAPSS
ncbi:MAG: hypothetical protein M3065_18020, partial [Actinomycetota bacterium]|nr:hypothetical protein [Actinomycetota bacterium]